MQVTDQELLEELSRRIEQKEASIKYIEHMTGKLLKLNEKYEHSKKILNEYKTPVTSQNSVISKEL